MHFPVLISSYPIPLHLKGLVQHYLGVTIAEQVLLIPRSLGPSNHKAKQTLENLEIDQLISPYWAHIGKIFPTTFNLVNYSLYCYAV